ncbi:MAG: hypothetical protein P1P88_18255 [Bacteroidales bacterium]|nr:hypothetical protein [Bacteroidales bacterium]
MSIRFFVLFFISFLLLSPVIKYFLLYFDNPIIIVAQDCSESIGLVKHAGLESKDDYKKHFIEFDKNLATKFDVKNYTFGDRLEDTLSFNFDEKETDFSELFNEINSKYINYNIGALVISTDGIYNKGGNPLYASKDFSFPIYVVALGDTTHKRDLIIKNAISNSIAFSGDYFPIEVLLSSYGFQNQVANIEVIHQGKVIVNQLVVIDKNDFSKQIKFEIQAKEKGLQSYQIRVAGKEGELSLINNSRQIIIDVVDDKKKVLILSHAVHPDIGAIKTALELNKNVQIESFTFDQFKKNISEYQLVIFHQIPTHLFNTQKIVSRLQQDLIPTFFIIGSSTNINSFNQLKTGNQIQNNKGLNEQLIPKLNNSFKLFELDDKFIGLIQECPPLLAPFGDYISDNQMDILLYQEIKGIKTNMPLLYFTKEIPGQTAKAAFLFGEGIWQWRIKDYLLHENHDQFDGFINKIVQYLALDIKKDRFMVYQNRIFNENEEIQLRAEFYNQSYELNNEPDVTFELSNGDNKKYNYQFSRNGKAYSINLGRLPEGNYRYLAKTEFEGKKYVKNGEFKVVPVNIEHLDLTANHHLLYQLAMQSGGKLFYPNQLKELVKELEGSDSIKPISHSIVDLVDIIELKWLFFLFVFFLSLEWFVRKYLGAY